MFELNSTKPHRSPIYSSRAPRKRSIVIQKLEDGRKQSIRYQIKKTLEEDSAENHPHQPELGVWTDESCGSAVEDLKQSIAGMEQENLEESRERSSIENNLQRAYSEW